MSSTNNNFCAIEQEMIQNDVLFSLNLFHHISSKKDASILILSIIPYFSLFIVESFKYFQSTNPAYAQTIERKYANILEASRNRIKLFDEKKRGIAGMIDLIDQISKAHHKKFILSHIGPLAKLKRMLQGDLGLYKFEGHLICTTHVAHFNSGNEPQMIEADMSALARAVGQDIGEYFGRLYTDFGLKVSREWDSFFHYDIPVGAIPLKDDVKANNYYASGFNGRGSAQINACIVLFQATIGFLHYILPRLVTASTDTTFKIKFVNLYHITSSLKKLQQDYDAALTQQSKDLLNRILDDNELNLIVSQPSFRNIVVHYGIRNVTEDQINRGVRFFGLIEHFYPGHSFVSLDQMLDQQIRRMALIFEEWANRF